MPHVPFIHLVIAKMSKYLHCRFENKADDGGRERDMVDHQGQKHVGGRREKKVRPRPPRMTEVGLRPSAVPLSAAVRQMTIIQTQDCAPHPSFSSHSSLPHVFLPFLGWAFGIFLLSLVLLVRLCSPWLLGFFALKDRLITPVPQIFWNKTLKCGRCLGQGIVGGQPPCGS